MSTYHRQIILDTETTGLEPEKGDRIIEIGCLELIDRRLTGKTYHEYINPQREVHEKAYAIHGISNAFLVNKPIFSAIVDSFLDFIKGAELIIHNAPFDIGFLDNELSLVPQPTRIGRIHDICKVLDTLQMARIKHPGQRNSLDVLCKRYNVDNSQRELHGAMLDAHLLTQVYLAMTGGQTSLFAETSETTNKSEETTTILPASKYDSTFVVIKATEEELVSHHKMLDLIREKSKNQCVWDHCET